MHNTESTAYQYWLHSQNEPDAIARGNYKRHTESPAFIDKWKGIDKMREEMGEEKFQQMVKEDEERKKLNN